ncbi:MULTISPECIES: class I SAM-dependent methyltransferase [Oscillatoriales]|uniref:class I SAM-dependent methyltransferase n=1 Tax=Oscillatoriales TaxID=1150 RepID=UPI0001C3863A|nr:methyltransferase type 11 [Arthrospira platensis str. Paraca]MDT9312385.1 class I SAM-dependent methyltransferase [Limnospira sp. Paracas R14]
MTTTFKNPPIGPASRLVNGILSIQPLAKFAKHQARQMMIDRAEKMGVPWRSHANTLLQRDWSPEFQQVNKSDLAYPEYYLRSFHAYDNGNLSWQAAVEVEVAALAVHAKIWPDAGVAGDDRLRQSYHDVLQQVLPEPPKAILDLGCSVGLSTNTMQQIYPDATMVGVDLSPYFLAIAAYNTNQKSSHNPPTWVHAPAEATGLPEHSFDLVSLCLVCHELPQEATRNIFEEARRLLRPNGHLAVMDMNPKSEVFAKMPPYILTLLKSTEPYLDQYFTLDLVETFKSAGFHTPTIVCNSPRHHTAIAKVNG